jgi:hypothetical protein
MSMARKEDRIMKVHPALRAASLVVLALAAARCARDDVRRLEEVPPEVAAHLHKVPNTNLLISEPPLTPVSPGKLPPLPEKKACASSFDSFAQVLFPVTLCYPLGFPDAGILTEVSSPAASSARTAPAAAKTYKLSTFEGKSFPVPMRCIQKSGPWLAKIVEAEQCDKRPNQFTLTIEGIPPCPQCPEFTWSGTLDQRPGGFTLILPLVDTHQTVNDCDPLDPTVCDDSASTTATPPP